MSWLFIKLLTINPYTVVKIERFKYVNLNANYMGEIKPVAKKVIEDYRIGRFHIGYTRITRTYGKPENFFEEILEITGPADLKRYFTKIVRKTDDDAKCVEEPASPLHPDITEKLEELPEHVRTLLQVKSRS